MTDLATVEPHQARDAEVSVLGAAMSGADIDTLAALVEASDFYAPHHEQVWDAVLRVHAAGNAPDMVSVRLALDSAAVKHDPLALHTMVSMVQSVANAEFYAEQVAEAAGKRRIQRAGAKLHQIGSGATPLPEAREMARQAVDDATAGRVKSRARSLATVMPAVIETAQNGRSSMLGTGWDDLDRIIGGLAPGRLVVFAARPGVGKSVAGTNLALHFAHHHGHAVLLSSMEMPEHEVGQRLLAAHARVNLTDLQNGHSDERSWALIAARTQEISDLPITIDDTPGQTVTDIRAAARDVQRTRDDLALIVVDYLQLIRTPGGRRNGNRSEEVSEIARGLKILARETGACVVAMAQVNREGAKHDSGPRMEDIREGGAENDADQVIVMHRPDEQIPEIDLKVDKNRHGPTGVCSLNLQGHYARLTAVTR